MTGESNLPNGEPRFDAGSTVPSPAGIGQNGPESPGTKQSAQIRCSHTWFTAPGRHWCARSEGHDGDHSCPCGRSLTPAGRL